MRLIVIEEKDIETVYLFEDNELGQMHVHAAELRKQLQVRRNNYIFCKILGIKNFI